MKRHSKTLIAASAIAAASLLTTSADAYEFGYAGAQQRPGLVLGNAAVNPPPGVYMFNQGFTYQAKIVGPGAPNIGGSSTSFSQNAGIVGLLWVPGWTFLGASYDAVFAQAVVGTSIGFPYNSEPTGFHNTFIAPVELSWKLGDSGFFAKAGFGMYVPTGTTSGPNGLGNAGTPWWTFQPQLVISYFKDGWNLTANMFTEFNTRNTITNYQSGDVFHAEFTATKTIDRWTIGPVATYIGQITNDKSSAFYGGAINANRYDIWAAGAFVGYNFGPATLNVWALQEISSTASGGTAGLTDTATVTKGFSVFASLNFRLWAPEQPQQPKIPVFHK